MRKFVQVIYSIPGGARKFVASFVTATVFYFAAYFPNLLPDVAKLGVPLLLLHAILFIILFAGVVFVHRILSAGIEEVRAQREMEKATVLHAYRLCDRILAESTSKIELNQTGQAGLAYEAAPVLEKLESLVKAAYEVFESTYGKHSDPLSRIDFEATCMTRSQIDGGITIPVCANAHNRKPRSMQKRENDPDLYNATVTANVYRSQSPCAIIVSDTSKSVNGGEYSEIYPNQKDRIKSSIVFPILSNGNRLLGTLVIHCDRVGFFNESHRKYLTDLLEIFTKRISHEIIKIESIERIAGESRKNKSTIPVEIAFSFPYRSLY